MSDMPESSPKYNLAYFQTDQFALSFTHPDVDIRRGNDPEESKHYELGTLIQQFLEKSSTIVQSFDGYEAAQLSVIRTHSFDAVPDLKECYVSKLASVRAPRITARPKSSVVFVKIDNGSKDAIKLFRMITGLETKILNTQMVERLKFESASPSWLGSGAPEGSGSGGPGGWPVAYRGSPARAPYQIRNLRTLTEPVQQGSSLLERILAWIREFFFRLFGGTNPHAIQDILTNSSKGDGVHVVILDTIHSQQELDDAFATWKDCHPLIRSLLRPGCLELHPITDQAHLERIKDLRVLGHDYEMKDHALFEAGIIHSIVPCAKIHIIQVLNDYGATDIETLIDGLERTLDIMRKYPTASFVINCSWMVNLPLGSGHFLTGITDLEDCLDNPALPSDDICFDDLFTYWDRLLEREICKKLREDKDWLKRQSINLETICNKIYAENSRVIAAAGNDRRRDQSVAPPARLPAALESAQGVGALPRNPELTQNGKRKTSTYSNLADTPGYVGVATLGGEEGEGHGLLGVYLGKFPGGEDNNTKWAWWSGTSDATPIFSAITAIALSDLRQSAGGQPNRMITQQAIDTLYNPRRFILESEGEGGVDILDLIQG